MLKSKIKNFVFCIAILIFGFWSLNFLTGCASTKEIAKGIIGISTKETEKSRADAIKKTFNYGYKDCYDRVLEALGRIGVYIYAKNKDMVAVYVSETDTTCVGIYFKQLDANNTLIEVASASTYAKELISRKLFSALEKEPL